MYRSLESWVNIAFSYRALLDYDTEGAPTYASSVSGYCYPEGGNTVVSDLAGKSVISNLKIYVNGLSTLKAGDEVTLESVIYIVKAVAPYYREGRKDILEVFL